MEKWEGKKLGGAVHLYCNMHELLFSWKCKH